jgi:hypothetical protein
VNPTDAATMMLMIAHFLALGVAVMVFLWMIFLQRRNRAAAEYHRATGGPSPAPLMTAERPNAWLAVRSLPAETVRDALGNRDQFQVSSQVNGWVVVTGPGLPHPDEDVDSCFRFLSGLSRQLGHVQFFHMEKFSGHHAWARMDDGCVTRAYAWAGETLWNQGAKTLAEKGLGMKCFDYGEDSGTGFHASKEYASGNLEKIPLLAARWSVDPGVLHRTDGLAGESSRFY